MCDSLLRGGGDRSIGADRSVVRIDWSASIDADFLPLFRCCNDRSTVVVAIAVATDRSATVVAAIACCCYCSFADDGGD